LATAQLRLSATSHPVGDQGAFILGHGPPDLEQELIVRILTHGSVQELNRTAPLGEFLDEDDDSVTGFTVDLFEAAVERLDLAADWQPTTFDTVFPGAQAGQYDIGASSIHITADRLDQATMVSYLIAGTQWFTQDGNPAGVDPGSPCGASVAVQEGTTQADDVESSSDECLGAGQAAVDVSTHPSPEQVTASVLSGEADAGAVDLGPVAHAFQQEGDALEQVGAITDPSFYGAVVSDDQPELAEVLASAFQSIIDDGTYDDILDEWNIPQAAVDTAEVNPDPESAG
jgi:polar amino acid transport system substrate-binding protein